MRIVRSPEAIVDLDEIWTYIATHDPDAADRTIDRIVAATARLASYPDSGSPHFDARPGLRSIVTGKHIVYYVVEQHTVRLLRIVHGARDRGDLDLA